VFVTTSLLVACTGGGNAGPANTTSAAPASSLVLRTNIDGQLKIGVLLPSSGAGDTIGEPMIRAVAIAVQDINDAGGVFGRDVLYVTQDEGTTSITAANAFEQLIDAHVDAIVGPASSRIALSLIDRIRRNQVLTCSPTATAIALSDRNDDGYFIRTVPSDALQARVLRDQIITTGRRATAIVYPNDDYGTRFANALKTDLETEVTVTLHTYDPANPSDVAQVATATAADAPKTDPRTIAVLGDKSAATMIAALRNLGLGPPATPVFVDDGMRHPDVSSTSNVSADVLEGVTGASALADPIPSATGSATATDWYRKKFAAAAPDTPIDFSAYAYDCTTLIALAAQIAQTDDGARMRQPAIDASRTGQPCHNYDDCLTALNGKLDIDLDGASGDIDLDPSGDPTRGQFDVFQIQGGRDVSTRFARAQS
jgi:branched-chain amino acid transport system substrate-binding protein